MRPSLATWPAGPTCLQVCACARSGGRGACVRPRAARVQPQRGGCHADQIAGATAASSCHVCFSASTGALARGPRAALEGRAPRSAAAGRVFSMGRQLLTGGSPLRARADARFSHHCPWRPQFQGTEKSKGSRDRSSKGKSSRRQDDSDQDEHGSGSEGDGGAAGRRRRAGADDSDEEAASRRQRSSSKVRRAVAAPA